MFRAEVEPPTVNRETGIAKVDEKMKPQMQKYPDKPNEATVGGAGATESTTEAKKTEVRGWGS